MQTSGWISLQKNPQENNDRMNPGALAIDISSYRTGNQLNQAQSKRVSKG